MLILARLDWGSVPGWLEAVGTVGSLFVGLLLLKSEINERRRREAEKLTEPARRVSAWCEGQKDKWVLAVKNGGDEAVYDCMIYACPLQRNKAVPGADPNAALEILFGVIPPGETLKDEYDKEALQPEGFHFPSVEVEFTDAGGKHWRRDARGAVKEICSRRPFC